MTKFADRAKRIKQALGPSAWNDGVTVGKVTSAEFWFYVLVAVAALLVAAAFAS